MPGVRYSIVQYSTVQVTLCVPGVRARAGRRDHRGAEAAGGAGAGGEGAEAQGDRGDAQQKGDRLIHTPVRMSSYQLPTLSSSRMRTTASATTCSR